MTAPIPHPPTSTLHGVTRRCFADYGPVLHIVPFLGNVVAIDKEVPLRSYELLAKQYGEIYHLNLVG